MAAGLGFKDFVTGEVLTAADVDGYLMQGVWVFASAAARDAAVTSPQEGNFAYLKDTNVTTYYTGSAWANLDTTGMTNPMTTTGDTIYSSSGSTPARLGIGSAGQVLTVASGVPSWATPASGGGMTLLSTTTLSGATTTISSISQDYFNLQIDIFGITNDTANGYFYIQFNSNGTNNKTIRNLTTTTWSSNDNTLDLNEGTDNNTKYGRNSPDGGWTVYVPNYTLSTGYNAYTFSGVYANVNGDKVPVLGGGGFSVNGAITSMLIGSTGGNFSAGTVKIYGVK